MLIEAARLSAAGRRLGFALLSHRDLSKILPRQPRSPGSSNNKAGTLPFREIRGPELQNRDQSIR